MKTGIDFVDDNISAKDFVEKITLIHSRVGVGKTSLVCKIASNVSKQDNQNILFVNTEMPSKMIIRKILSDYSNVSLSDLTKIKPKVDEIIDMKGKNTTFKIKTVKKLNIDLLKNDLNFSLIIVDGVLSKDEFESLIEFKKEFNGILIVTSQMNKLANLNESFNDIFNYIILESKMNGHEKTHLVSIMTETTVLKTQITLDHNTLNIRKKL